MKSDCKGRRAIIAQEYYGMTLKEALYSLATRPVELVVRRWNWKAVYSTPGDSLGRESIGL